MKNNKDRNNLNFGPRDKDVEEEARRLKRAKNFESFEVDLRLDLGDVPEVRPGVNLPPFPEAGSLNFQPGPFRFVIAAGNSRTLVTSQTVDGGDSWTRTTASSRSTSNALIGTPWRASLVASSFYGVNNLSRTYSSGYFANTTGNFVFRKFISPYSGFDGTYSSTSSESGSFTSKYVATDGVTVISGNTRSIDGINFSNMSGLINPETEILTSSFNSYSTVSLGLGKYVRAVWFTNTVGPAYLFETSDSGLTWSPVFEMFPSGSFIPSAISPSENYGRVSYIDATNYKNGYAYMWAERDSITSETTFYLLIKDGFGNFTKTNLSETFPEGSVFTAISESYDGGILLAGNFTENSIDFHMAKTYDDGQSFTYVGSGDAVFIVQKISMTPSGYGVSVAGRSGDDVSFAVRKTSDFGNSWTSPTNVTFTGLSQPTSSEIATVWGVVPVE